MLLKIPDIRCAIPGRHTIRHPGLVPGPWPAPGTYSRHPGLVPGPIQKGRDLETTSAGCFIRSRISRSDFGTTGSKLQDPEYALRDSGT